MLPTVSGEFRVVADPELRFAPSGVAVGTMRVVANSRKKQGEEWVDDKVCWLRATAFKTVAENMVETFLKSDLVLITGKLQTEEWEKDGEKKQSYTILVDTIGPSLMFRPAEIKRGERGPSTTTGTVQRGAPAEDPWATPPPGGEEPPF